MRKSRFFDAIAHSENRIRRSNRSRPGCSRLRIECGGWCPKGRKAEDGRIAAKYPLIETPSANYVQRTEWNVRDTGGTVIFSIDSVLTGVSRKTAKFAVKHNKPCLHLYPG